MDLEKFEKMQELVAKMRTIDSRLSELNNGCCIVIDKYGKTTMRTDSEGSVREMPDWFSQKINGVMYEYRAYLTAVRSSIKEEMDDL